LDDTPSSNIWWGEFELAHEARLDWTIGPLSLWLESREREVVVHSYQGAERLAEEIAVAQPGSGDVPDHFTSARFPSRETPTKLAVVPALADRPVVILPRIPVSVVSGESLRLYMSTPLWVRLELPNPVRQLMDLPTFRPSDTWFGINTMVGELCYASGTKARVGIEHVNVRPSRAITAVTITNPSASTLVVDRLCLPAPRLDLYVAPSGQLWTQSVHAEWHGNALGSRVRIDHGGPQGLPRSSLVSRAREFVDRGVFTKAFNLLQG
jgi:hypothetical protein